MPDTRSHHEVEVVEATREEGRAILDRAAREALNISGDEFLAKWDDGDYEEADDPSVTRVAMLIPFAPVGPRGKRLKRSLSHWRMSCPAWPGQRSLCPVMAGV